MNNLNFFIEDNITDNSNSIIDYDTVYQELEQQTSSNNSINTIDRYNFLIEEYDFNYTYKYLKIIANYYKLKIPRKKTDLIEVIVNFELNPNNETIVNKRLNMWSCIEILNSDPYFSKFIVI